jgi:hypothetical protein
MSYVLNIESEAIAPSAVPPEQTLHRRVGKINKILIITNILYTYLSFYRYKMPRQYALAVLRRPSPPPIFSIFLSLIIIIPNESSKPKKRTYERYTVT